MSSYNKNQFNLDDSLSNTVFISKKDFKMDSKNHVSENDFYQENVDSLLFLIFGSRVNNIPKNIKNVYNFDLSDYYGNISIEYLTSW